MERYRRIMTQRLINAVTSLDSTHKDLKGSIDNLNEQIQKTAKLQSRQQGIIITLTVIIVVATVCYTFSSCQAVTVMREANWLQEKLINQSNDKNFKIKLKMFKSLVQKAFQGDL